MTIIIAAVLASILVAAACAGSGSTQTEGASLDELDRCPHCGNYIPCNCNQHENTPYHHHEQWIYDAMNRMSEDDSRSDHAYHHHGDSDHWN